MGLVARGIVAGHQTAFVWHQAYGGVDPYLVAGVFAVFGASPLTLNLVPAVLAAVVAVLTWRIGRRIFPTAPPWPPPWWPGSGPSRSCSTPPASTATTRRPWWPGWWSCSSRCGSSSGARAGSTPGWRGTSSTGPSSAWPAGWGGGPRRRSPTSSSPPCWPCWASGCAGRWPPSGAGCLPGRSSLHRLPALAHRRRRRPLGHHPHSARVGHSHTFDFRLGVWFHHTLPLLYGLQVEGTGRWLGGARHRAGPLRPGPGGDRGGAGGAGRVVPPRPAAGGLLPGLPLRLRRLPHLVVLAGRALRGLPHPVLALVLWGR